MRVRMEIRRFNDFVGRLGRLGLPISAKARPGQAHNYYLRDRPKVADRAQIIDFLKHMIAALSSLVAGDCR